MIEPVKVDSAVGSAVFTPDGRHRLRLDRIWGSHRDERAVPTVLFVMLNPSLAGAHDDDPTLRKCMGFTRRWNYSRLTVVNLFSMVTPFPEELAAAPAIARTTAATDPYIGEAAKEATLIVCAWGTHAGLEPRRALVVEQLLFKMNRAVGLRCLGKTAKGHPRHPARLPYATPLERY